MATIYIHGGSADGQGLLVDDFGQAWDGTPESAERLCREVMLEAMAAGEEGDDWTGWTWTAQTEEEGKASVVHASVRA